MCLVPKPRICWYALLLHAPGSRACCGVARPGVVWGRVACCGVAWGGVARGGVVHEVWDAAAAGATASSVMREQDGS